MTQYIRYEAATGRILTSMTGEFLDPRYDDDEPPEGQKILKLESAVSIYGVYILDDAVVERPTFTPELSAETIPSDGQGALTISGFPAGSTLSISGPIEETWEGSGTDTDITVNLPGEYVLSIECWPYQDVEVKFNAA